MTIHCTYNQIVPLEQLINKRNPRNPKKHPPEQIAVFTKIIQHQGVRRPIVVSKRSGLIVAGHGLLEALEAVGATEAPVDYQDFASEAEELAHMLADNMLAEYGVTSEVQCNLLIKELEEAGLDRDLSGIIAEIEEKAEEERPEGIYELQPEFDEAYDGVLIFCKTGQEFAQLSTMLDLPKTMNRKGHLGTTHVIHARRFFDLCKSKS